jgi:hypothetical protein
METRGDISGIGLSPPPRGPIAVHHNGRKAYKGIFAVSIVVVLGLFLNAAGIFFRPSGGPYAVALTWALGVFGFIFVQTMEIFLHREPPA